MYISRLRLRNWRNFTNADVELGQMVYMIGPNASGKSNFLDVFRFLRDIAKPNGGGLQQAVESRGGMKKLRCLAARRKPEIEIDVRLVESHGFGPPTTWRYVLHLTNEKFGKRRVLVAKEEVYKNGGLLVQRPNLDDEKDTDRLTQTHLEQINMNREFRDVASFLEDVIYLHLVPQLLKFGDQISGKRLEDDPFGQGFLDEIAATRKNIRDSRLRRIEAILKDVIPHVEELRFAKDEINGRPHIEMRYVHWRPNAGWQREDQFSDGTLRLIALAWTLLSSNNMILLEEPELSLHNRIVEQIPDLISSTRKSRKKAGGQILVSTHSEALLSSKSIDASFLVLRPSEKGESTSIAPPTEEDVAAMQAGMTPADILLPQTAESIGSI